MIRKSIHPDAFNFDFQVSTMLNVYSGGFDKCQFQKSAALFDDRIKDIKPMEKMAYVQLISTGAMEFFGPNNNADGFNESKREFTFPFPAKGVQKTASLGGGLEAFHDSTFMKHGGVYKNHMNRTKGGSPQGQVKFAAYNPDMHRGELIVELPVDKWDKQLQKIARNEPVYWSMGCSIEADCCSMCGHRSRTRDEYCEHLKRSPLALSKEGHQVFAINDTPIFHDISEVFRPADKISFTLRKVASETDVVLGADLADVDGWGQIVNPFAKTAAEARLDMLKKLAAMEKKIMMSPAEGGHKAMILSFHPSSGFGAVDERSEKELSRAEPEDAISATAARKEMLTPDMFSKIMLKDKAGEVPTDLMKEFLPGIFQKLLGQSDEDLFPILSDDAYDKCVCSKCRDRGAEAAADRLRPSLSLDHEPVRMRVMRITIMAPGKRIEKKAAERVATPSELRAASYLAAEYVKYQLAFLAKHAGEDTACLTLAGNLSSVIQ